MQVKLMIRINQEERLSIRNEIFPNTELVVIITSTVAPDNTFTAGIDVIAAVKRTKKKLAFALRTGGSNGREIIPASSIDRDKKNNNDSVINIRCAVNLFYFSLFSFIWFK